MLLHVTELRQQFFMTVFSPDSSLTFSIFPDVSLTCYLPLPSGWTTSSAEAVYQLRPNAQPRT